MSNTTTQTITTDAQTILAAVNAVLPAIEALVPAAGQNAQLITLASTAASALLPLISDIPLGSSNISVAQQASQLARIYAIISGNSLSGVEWKIQT